MANESEALREWREATPDDDSDEGSSSGSDSGSTEYESEELTQRPQKKARGEEANDPDFDPFVETQSSHKQPLQIPPGELEPEGEKEILGRSGNRI